MGKERKVYNILVGKLEGKRKGRLMHRWEDGIRMDLRQIGWGSVFNWLRIGAGGGLL
jgi:hypothetical protein